MKESPLISFILKYWVLIVFLSSVIGIFYTNQLHHNDFEKRILAVELKTDGQMIESQKIQVQLSQIQTDLSWVKSALSKQ